MTASMDDGDTLVTDLGIDHQLIIKEHGWKNVRATVVYFGLILILYILMGYSFWFNTIYLG